MSILEDMPRRYMKLMSRRQAVSILRDLKIWFIPA